MTSERFGCRSCADSAAVRAACEPVEWPRIMVRDVLGRPSIHAAAVSPIAWMLAAVRCRPACPKPGRSSRAALTPRAVRAFTVGRAYLVSPNPGSSTTESADGPAGGSTT